ncbi:MAG: RsmD family RNA methyltransferase [Treponema sp.]|jgi:16S rRNA (guanine(966)-N(2))-methyltransferase RsmD|nr:RsmD family RNA methyltransferase [Treponema sp.]
MRVTGGLLKGRRVEVPPGIIRPSMDRMRESVFAVLGDLSGLSFLDIFSGSGIIALEAASRGAQYIEAVEADPLKRKILLQNAAMSPVRINCRFIPAELYIKRSKREFDIVFMDPPFKYQFKQELLQNLAASPILSNETIVLIHRPKNERPPEPFSNLEKSESREYGHSIVDFYKAVKQLNI